MRGRLILSLRSLHRLIFVTQVIVCVNHFLHFRLAFRLVQCRWHFVGMPTPTPMGRLPLLMFVSYSPRVVNFFLPPKRKNPPKFSEGLCCDFGYYYPLPQPSNRSHTPGLPCAFVQLCIASCGNMFLFLCFFSITIYVFVYVFILFIFFFKYFSKYFPQISGFFHIFI